MASEHTAADDIVYDLTSIQYHALKGAQVYDRYIEDAHNHADVVESFRDVRAEDDRRALWAHDLLRDLTKERGGIDEEPRTHRRGPPPRRAVTK